MPVPGPAALGRGVVVNAGGAIPAPWITAPVVTVDDAVLKAPAAVVAALHAAWAEREPVVVELAVDPARFRAPQDVTDAPWRLDPDFEPWFDRLHFLVWANTYDARAGDPIWWWGRKAARLGATPTPDGATDVALPDGTEAWVDGGPRRPWSAADLAGAPVVHSESVELGRLAVGPEPVAPAADLAPDQLAAVAHQSGAARVIAPAGSGKTRVLTERLRHLLADCGLEPESLLAVAYNKEAQLELERRTTGFRPRVRTLNALGYWVLAEHRGGAPSLLDERDTRRLVESLLPGRRQRRANTDPIGPYLEALGTVRLGLRDPAEVEGERDDVDGLADLFRPYRIHLADRGVVDFDEQIYGAIEVLLADGEFRRSMQGRCRHLLVDEFQDLTPAHVLLIRLLALPTLDVFGVGDDDQVIYGHNSADPAFLIDYGALFPGATPHPLTVNYRCPVEVVDGARTLLAYNHRRVPKEITAGPDADPATGALRVVHHGPDDAAQSMVDVVQGWLAEDGVLPSSLAVLARVNSLLLAPQVALAEAGLPLQSVLRPEVLERTGMRAALAYLRLGVAGDAMSPRDIVEVMRRPTRGLPQWFPDRLERRSTWSVAQLKGIADQVPDKEAAKVLRLADDLAAVVAAARGGTTRSVLEVVRDDIGLGTAMGMLDRTGGGQGSSHLDDLEGLLGVADLHPDPAGFEPWLRRVFGREADPEGITLSTIHRVKGREWDRVLIFGVADGVLPHRLSTDVEEERRVLHVGITRGRHRVAVLADRTRRSPFLAELAGTAPKRPAPRPGEEAAARKAEAVQPQFKKAAKGKGAAAAVDGIEVREGMVLKVLGGYEGAVEEVDGRSARLRLPTGGTLTVRYGERVEHDGRTAPLAPPTELWGAAGVAEAALRAWRTARAKADGMPAYIVLTDASLRGIALSRPTDAAGLLACDGIGPTKLERYGDDVLAALDEATG
ncbi:ATP-dependent DNA helicase UvrD2 [Aquihabitans sp. G128]|uniref:ATP-dependent DNA helicase UvrD2 n=1 Tax=Aquihabitans sp. G128 TaxID=2849779 RepID=UPI001C2263ED|nr:ATP-dependent DNA helicase UvrD2 [Aquihabitans sp. G128]QXC61536.1 ATP-dependent DNA helicase UvrD2 [Aquihabitans sp. G128]